MTSPDVAALRRALGAVVGKKALSRGKLAKLLGASSGSIYNWERGTTEVSEAFVAKIEDLAARVKKGEITKAMLGGAKSPSSPRPAATKSTSRSTRKATLTG